VLRGAKIFLLRFLKTKEDLPDSVTFFNKFLATNRRMQLAVIVLTGHYY